MLSLLNSSLKEERPIIFFDSHPEPPAGIVWDSYTRLKKQLTIAWTGDVVLDVKPDLIRLQWFTTDGNFGKRDYELRECQDARDGFDKLCTLPDVARCMIVGYPSQNPYSIGGLIESPFAKEERRKKEILEGSEYRDFVPREKKEPAIGDRVDDIIREEELREKKAREQPTLVAEDV